MTTSPLATSPEPHAPPVPDRSGLTWLEGATLSVLLALAGIAVVGYRFGDSNHGITIPILKRLMDRSLYPGDVMVATADRFPTVFYRTLAALLPGPDWIPAAFFVLYVVSIAATLAGAFRLGRWAGGPTAGAVALLFAFPVRIGLAGEALYRVAFSHSHLASALVIWALVWFLEGRRLLPLLVLSVGAYNHLLYSVYVLVPLCLVVLAEAREVGRRTTLVRLGAAALPLIPLAIWTVSNGTPMTPEWLALLKLRSSHHSFPGNFGTDLPDAAALLLLGVLAAAPLPEAKRRLFALFLAGIAVQFVLGTIFTEWMPLKAVLQYQPHRCWRFLLILLYGLIGAGVVTGYRSGGLSRVASLFTGIVVFVPGLEALLPVACIAQAAATRPEPPAWARVAVAAALVGVGGWGDRPFRFEFIPELTPRLLTATALSAAALALVILAARTSRRRAAAVGAVALATLVWFGPAVYGRARARWESGMWRDVQDWVRQNTPRSAVFLTPPKEAAFRVFSERTIVGEWKDGTQQYFDDAFVREWGARMEALDRFTNLSDAEMLSLAWRFGASHVVTPARPERPGLVLLYQNRQFAVYRAAASGTR